MSIIAVKGIPQTWRLSAVAKHFGKAIHGPFEVINFGEVKQNIKTVYLGLSETMDPARVIEEIHTASPRLKLKLTAFVPNTIPDFALASKRRPVLKPKLKRGKLDSELPYQVIQRTHHELLLEIQYKYPGLYNLSRKTGHKLLDEIAKIIFERIKDIMGAHVETRENCFKLSSNYRKTHPHFGDFQMILSTLHELQDASGAPRSQLLEKELLQQPTKPFTIDNIPVDVVKSACNKYSERILKAMTSHIKSLECTPAENDGEDAIARKKVREEMKKMLPYMPTIVKQVVAKHFMPQQTPMHRIRIYGEPFLPSKDAMSPFVKRYHGGASRVIRHPRMYNLLMFKIPQKQYAQLMAMDGTVVTGAKLVIRSDNPVYESSAELRSEMSAALGGPRDAPVLPMIDDIEEEIDTDTRMEE